MARGEHNPSTRAWLLSAPALLWMAVLFLIPVALLVGISFYTSGNYGEVERPLTLDNYKRFMVLAPSAGSRFIR